MVHVIFALDDSIALKGLDKSLRTPPSCSTEAGTIGALILVNNFSRTSSDSFLCSLSAPTLAPVALTIQLRRRYSLLFFITRRREWFRSNLWRRSESRSTFSNRRQYPAPGRPALCIEVTAEYIERQPWPWLHENLLSSIAEDDPTLIGFPGSVSDHRLLCFGSFLIN